MAQAAHKDGTAQLPQITTSITVTANVQVDTPSSVVALSRERIAALPGVNLDDRLRQLPGFTLFRRTSSLVAHPTTQGVSLRGIGGASGASRTLVLWDGVPLNDPFGGWVYWDRIDPWDVERIEVTESASTSVFGDRAMGGVISLFSREPTRRRLEAGYEGGSAGTHEIEMNGSGLWSRWGVSADARAFTTNGYFIVPPELRGSVDRRADLSFISASARADWLGSASRVFLRADILGESRHNGTVLQHNSTGLGSLSGRYVHETPADGISAMLFTIREQFHSTFSSVAADRNSERLTLRQRVPADAEGGAFVWQHRGASIETTLGGDVAREQGFSDETAYPGGERRLGGALWPGGAFAQARLKTSLLQVFAGARGDSAAGGHVVSPSAGLVAGRGRWRGRGAVYRSFRAPTLNELYRDFRVGNVVTRANAALRPEELFGAEAGVDFRTESMNVSAAAFRNDMRRLILNATLSTSPNLIVRQRQNLAGALTHGAELAATRHIGPVSAAGRYLFVDSRLSTGARMPQAPKHQGTASLEYARGGTLISASVRSYGWQFEDERNQTRAFLLPGFATVQLVARRELNSTLTAIVVVENALGRRYIVGYTPTPNIGPPRLWRLGVRWRLR